jgi:hypothetical protein
MSELLKCPECGVEITSADALADAVVQDDQGVHHRECVAEEETAGAAGIDLEAENERRRAMGDPPLTETEIEARGHAFHNAVAKAMNDGPLPTPLQEETPPWVEAVRAEGMASDDREDPGDVRVRKMEREENRGRYDLEGR